MPPIWHTVSAPTPALSAGRKSRHSGIGTDSEITPAADCPSWPGGVAAATRKKSR
jgi:hypothetical protein